MEKTRVDLTFPPPEMFAPTLLPLPRADRQLGAATTAHLRLCRASGGRTTALVAKRIATEVPAIATAIYARTVISIAGLITFALVIERPIPGRIRGGPPVGREVPAGIVDMSDGLTFIRTAPLRTTAPALGR